MTTTLRSADEVARLLDHAILHPTVTPALAEEELDAVASFPLASVCIKPSFIPLAVERLGGTGIGVGTVIGFPHGSHATEAKVAEAQAAMDAGAVELDMVVNVGWALGGHWREVESDIAGVLAAARKSGALLKVIFETDYLPDDATKIRLCEICGKLGVDFVKTSTGFGFVKDAGGKFGYRGATEHDVALMRKHSPTSVGVKPSGGIRSLDDVEKFVALGATRIGTASAQAIMKAAHERFGGTHAATAHHGRGKLEY